ncbi:hypothetical protein [Haloarchaeobius iranensis]|uniref:LexA-binding, inner membrane-associated hydrolase n=1 Tax=Haloarchaeobius iranensis TaxID=996166 RepID=A0A1G9V4T8_9EURY|nr:hypothetical protein [Haloarchaeobius iranensis]SDM67182.1 hypothetical protein SAMN05192554_105193 [Haloarchaeobius iranensis]
MSDLLTHALTAFAVATVASWVVPWLARRHVPLATAGAVVPDLAKGYFVTGDPQVTVAGVTGSWYALQTAGVVTCLLVAGVMLVERAERRVALAALLGGTGLHIGMDYLVIRAGGVAPPYLYPLTWAELPSVDAYLSSSVWPSLVALPVAALVWYVDRRGLAPGADSTAPERTDGDRAN